MVIHAVYYAGVHKLHTVNRPALFWVFAQAFGNLFGAGVWGFMHTLPQINLYSHGTQMAAAHGHLAFVVLLYDLITAGRRVERVEEAKVVG